jgi:ABC-type amino acid transport substrate-binding protein
LKYLKPAAAAVLLWWLGVSMAQDVTGLAKVRDKGVLNVALYHDFPPFSYEQDGRSTGIDVELATLIAEKLGVSASVRLVPPDETMEDDLRISERTGHYLGGVVADVMLHVPYDPEFARGNDRVRLIAPYYREQIVVALDPGFGDRELALDVFTREKVGVELDTLADLYLLSAYNGQIRDNVVHFRSVAEAARALKQGELAGVMAPRAELQAALGDQAANYRLGPIQMPGLRQSGWDVGAAVKADHGDLAVAVEEAVAALQAEGELERIFQRFGTTYQTPSRLRRAGG